MCVHDGHSRGGLKMKERFRNGRVIQPVGKMKFYADSAFIAHYNSNKLAGFAADFEQHGVFRPSIT